MFSKPRTILAFSCLGAGVFLAPFLPVESETIDWQSMTDAYEEPIFYDGLENGTTDQWSVTVGGTTLTFTFHHNSKIAEDILLSIDKNGHGWVPTTLLAESGIERYQLTAEPVTEVHDCTVRVAQRGVIITFSLPHD